MSFYNQTQVSVQRYNKTLLNILKAAQTVNKVVFTMSTELEVYSFPAMFHIFLVLDTVSSYFATIFEPQ